MHDFLRGNNFQNFGFVGIAAAGLIYVRLAHKMKIVFPFICGCLGDASARLPVFVISQNPSAPPSLHSNSLYGEQQLQPF